MFTGDRPLTVQAGDVVVGAVVAAKRSSWPSAQCSRFQMGAVALTSSIAQRAASSAASRCGEGQSHGGLGDLQHQFGARVRSLDLRMANPGGGGDHAGTGTTCSHCASYSSRCTPVRSPA